MLQAVGHIAIGDAERKTFGNSGLADSGFTDQHRIILGPAGQYLDRSTYFLVATDYGIELTCACNLRQVAGKFLERVIAVFCPGCVSGTSTA